MGFFKEFKEFAIRGNVIDLAVGVIIGAAFAKITDSLINDLLMPLLGIVVGKLDFSGLYIPLSDKVPWGLPLAEAKKLGAVVAYGNFISVLINFLLLAFCVFLMVKAINRLRRQAAADTAAAPPPAPTPQETLLKEIRDELRKAGPRADGPRPEGQGPRLREGS